MTSDAGVAALLPVAITAPIVGAIAAPLLAPLRRWLPFAVGVLALSVSTGTLLLAAPKVYGMHGRILVHYLGNWRPFGGGASLGIAVAADPFGLTFALLTAGLGALLVLAALSELGRLGTREVGGLSCLFLLLLAALIGAALTADVINLFVWFQVAALASYGLTGFFLERPIAIEAAFKLIVLTSAAGFFVFIGAAILYRQHGALNFGQLHDALQPGLQAADALAAALLLCGFATKAGLMPFHGWLPDAHTPAPGAVSALFSGLMVDLGVIGIVRVSLLLDPSAGAGHRLRELLAVFGIVSACAGALLALGQNDLKRLLAWDTVSQTGIVVVGFTTANAQGVGGAMYHLLNHGLFKGLLFLCAGSIVHITGKTDLDEMGGLWRHLPVAAFGFTVGVLAIAGIPPFNGYPSLGLLHEGVHEAYGPLTLLAVELAQALTVAALVRAAYLAFYRRRAQPYEELDRPRLGMRVTVAVLSTGCVALGVAQAPVLRDVIAPGASSLLDPSGYASTVLLRPTGFRLLPLHFAYADAKDVLASVLSALLGLVICWLAIRRPAPAMRIVRPLQRLHTGSVNDYTAFAIAGLALAIGVAIAS